MNSYRRRKKSFLYNPTFIIATLSILLFFFLLIFLNFFLKPKNINITFLDEKAENSEIKSFTENLLKENSKTFLNFIFLDEENISQKVHKEFSIVSEIKISKKINLDLNVVVSKNQEFFYTCMGEDSGFLVRCMLGNTDGEYYSGLEYSDVSDASKIGKKINIEINPKVLFDVETSEKVVEPDSLAGTRIYLKEDFKVLRELVLWLQKNGFAIKKVYVNELKIVDIYTEAYMIRVNLDKGYVDTVKDFETISRTGSLQKYINGEKGNIDYIDLSYKNKVFYKLKNDMKNDKMSTTSASSTHE